MPGGSPLYATYREAYGTVPTAVAFAPGRVNLIGEHIDYTGLGVLPMALQRGVTVAFRGRDDDLVNIRSTARGYAPRRFALRAPIPPYPSGDWGNYVKAAAQALLARFDVCRGMDAVVESQVPVAAGLSSSSALVVAVALALLWVAGESYDPIELAALLAEGERYVGTRGGGMDQAVALAGRAGMAVRIDFDPLRVRHLPVPAEWRFVVASSLTAAEKSGAAQRVYNRRTVECREALEAVVRAVGLDVREVGYAGLLERFSGEELLMAAGRVLEGRLLRRFRHVVSEGGRVVGAEQALRTRDLRAFGALMTASHASLRDDYDVSTPELDALVDVALEAGAAGARLTGAGLGGCVVALTDAGNTDRVLRALVEGFYSPRGAPQALDDVLFVATPSDGACVRVLTGTEAWERS